MNIITSTLVILILGSAFPATAQVATQPKAPGIESGDYVWNEIKDEKLLALRANADRARGIETYRLCHGCHRTGAQGTPDGAYPNLAGQHDTVLIKQLVDIQVGQRDNPKMFPFASKHEISPQDIADLAVYLSSLPPPKEVGLGEGKKLARGESLYNKDCAKCHGRNGEGSAEKFYPKVADQHFLYLKREVKDIAIGKRRNSNPKMVSVVKRYNDEDIAAVSDYMARLGSRPEKR